jgi:hypothetical protein
LRRYNRLPDTTALAAGDAASAAPVASGRCGDD